MNKKIIFFIIFHLNFIEICTSESEKSFFSQVVSTVGKTMSDIFKQNSQEKNSSVEFKNDASCSCCCCSFKSITSWFSQENEDLSNDHYLRYHCQPHRKTAADTEIT